MSRQNKVNPNHYTMAGRLTPDDLARERTQQAGVRGGTRRSKPMASWMARDNPQPPAETRAEAEFDLAASEGAPLPGPKEERPAEPAQDAPRAAKTAARDVAKKRARKAAPARARKAAKSARKSAPKAAAKTAVARKTAKIRTPVRKTARKAARKTARKKR